jgi:hypothetical protein
MVRELFHCIIRCAPSVFMVPYFSFLQLFKRVTRLHHHPFKSKRIVELTLTTFLIFFSDVWSDDSACDFTNRFKSCSQQQQNQRRRRKKSGGEREEEEEEEKEKVEAADERCKNSPSTEGGGAACRKDDVLKEIGEAGTSNRTTRGRFRTVRMTCTTLLLVGLDLT